MRTPRLPVVDWNDAPADLKGLVRFAERRNLVSARVPSHFNWPLPLAKFVQFDNDVGREAYLSLEYITYVCVGSHKTYFPWRHSNATNALPYCLPTVAPNLPARQAYVFIFTLSFIKTYIVAGIDLLIFIKLNTDIAGPSGRAV